MAAVSLSNFKLYRKHEGEVEVVYLISPSTMDSNDTVDITTLLNGRTLVNLQAWDTTEGDAVTATYATATDIITVDAAGGTTDHVYSIKVEMLR